MKPYDVTKIFVDPHSTSVSLVPLEVGPTYYDCSRLTYSSTSRRDTHEHSKSPFKDIDT